MQAPQSLHAIRIVYSYVVQVPMYLLHMHVFNERCEGRKKEASKVKQTNKTKQHSTHKAVTFPRKNELPRVGLEPTTLYTLDRVLYQLSYQGSTAGWAQTRRPADSLTGSGLRSRCQWSIATARCIQYIANLDKL